MTIQEALDKVVKNWQTLEKSEKGGVEAVWIYEDDTADAYEVDEEWIGVTARGNVAWAYASGCSCWDGDYDAHDKSLDTIKSFVFTHDNTGKEWEAAIIKFAEGLGN